MEESNYWSDIKPADIVVPKNHLSQLADSFNKAMGSKMIMDSTITIKDDLTNLESLFSEGEPTGLEQNLVIRVSITVPELGGYSMQIMKVVHKVNCVYPCVIYNTLKDNVQMSCKDGSQFIDNVKMVITSPEMKAALSNILAQIQ